MSLSLIISDEGAPTFILSTSTHSKLPAVPDEDLTFEQFGQAAIYMLKAMCYCNWNPSHVKMFIFF
ncbi:hypothetical protein J3R82DRAFT_2701 [Butyriboletus roseoflavus]|nr:hypothetical protein J3R82DRAFT_2701 [Butyriboletus roseoflavus]